jgi:hypothetical protein
VSICRIALSWLGANPIISLEVTEDDSLEAQLCKDNYEGARDAVLEEADWTFAMAEARITALVNGPLWLDGNFFQLPSDCLRVVDVLDTSGISFDVWEIKSRKVIVDADAIFISYIRRCTDPTQFSPTFVQALAARLAAILAPAITNSKTVAESMWTLYAKSITVAQTNDGIQGGDKPLGKSTLVDVRRRRGAYATHQPIIR